MTRVVIALLFLAGCTSQMKYSNVVRIRNVCSSDINVFIPEYVFGGNVIKQHHIYLPVNGIDVLSYFYTENINDGFQYEEAFTVKIARVILTIRLLSYHQDVKKNLGKTI